VTDCLSILPDHSQLILTKLLNMFEFSLPEGSTEVLEVAPRFVLRSVNGVNLRVTPRNTVV
jgi:hypothetical protein